MHFLSKFFLLSDEQTPIGNAPNWQISVLRILLSLGMLLCFAITLHTFGLGLKYNFITVLILPALFFITTSALLSLSARFYHFTAHTLLLAIVFASVCMNFFLINLKLAQVGSMYMFALS
ncbi:hypothetical protein RT723_00425 [Psychrosphaera aquimarina]|uniref:Uncharacterized protein n=1 Tax=Psychrosphaera aquimarina TaxID=2044854 RepID=A0ABU3QVS9_9GAMM|nr:hypothetical protein [Psychrosphaera aquimarina]MDU0111505.1 hypothetical protein [Psychrosphaera aquimarina]